MEELEKAAVMADGYALTHKKCSKSGNPQQKRYHGSGNRENISRNMDDRKRQGKSTENVGLVSKGTNLGMKKRTFQENRKVRVNWSFLDKI